MPGTLVLLVTGGQVYDIMPGTLILLGDGVRHAWYFAVYIGK